MASAKGNITLSGSSIIPPPVVDPDTEVSLTDFAYVQAMFASAKLKHPNYSISAVQNAFIELIATDTNRAAQKTKAYYDSLVLIGKAQAEVFKMISTDFGLKLNN
jgi:hypothetical protein